MKKLLRIIGLVLGIIALLAFLVPFMVAGILNIGNLTGIIVFSIWTGYMIFMPAVNKWINAMWDKKVARVSMLLGAIAMILCVVLVVIESGCIIGACAKAPAKDATAVVLGCRVYGERASLSLVERLEAAYEYLEKNPNANCVVSGGQGDGESISEAECMYRWLVAKGIAPERIYKEDKSTSTEENIAFSKNVIKENGLQEEIAIITSEYHTYRATLIAEANEFEYGAAPGKTAAWLFPTFYVRELYAILAEWIF